jgi:hypothetical protein
MDQRSVAGDTTRGGTLRAVLLAAAGLTLAAGAGCQRYQLERASVEASDVVARGMLTPPTADRFAIVGVPTTDE